MGAIAKCCAKQWECGGGETMSRGDSSGVCPFVEEMRSREMKTQEPKADICCWEGELVMLWLHLR